jgi:glycerophosphoryl diester phosphodiesterase
MATRPRRDWRKRVLKVGYRGAPRVATGNMMASFRAAWEPGCDWVECDCRASADGVAVLAHDDTVTDLLAKL